MIKKVIISLEMCHIDGTANSNGDPSLFFLKSLLAVFIGFLKNCKRKEISLTLEKANYVILLLIVLCCMFLCFIVILF